MSPPAQKSPGGDEEGGRKRVGKACDRCRVKKSKCDGATPCQRCATDNETCVFGNTQKKSEKVYPKGFPEMLENDRLRLIKALKTLYQDLVDARVWTRGDLPLAPDGFPLTHHLLEATGSLVLHPQDEPQPFEEDARDIMREMFQSHPGSSTIMQASPDQSRRTSFEHPLVHSSDTGKVEESPSQAQGPSKSLLTPDESPNTTPEDTGNTYFSSFAADSMPEGELDDACVDNMDMDPFYQMPGPQQLENELAAMASSPIVSSPQFSSNPGYSTYNLPQYGGYSVSGPGPAPSGGFIDPRHMVAPPLGHHLTSMDPRHMRQSTRVDALGLVYDESHGVIPNNVNATHQQHHL